MAKKEIGLNPELIEKYRKWLGKVARHAGKEVSVDVVPFTGAPLIVLRHMGMIVTTALGRRKISAEIKKVTPESLLRKVRQYWRDQDKSKGKGTNNKAPKAPKAPKKRKYTRKEQGLPAPRGSDFSAVIPYVEQTSDSVSSIDKRLTNIESMLFRMALGEKE